VASAGGRRGSLTDVARILVVDNYDSFVYNLVQYLGQLGAEPLVYRNDAIDVATAQALRPDGLLVSPGPGRPESAGVSNALIAALAGEVPVLGVCLGHQCIGEVFGGRVVRTEVMHGKTSSISHDGRGVFEELPDPLTATRYHSLVVDAGAIPGSLEVSAWTADGTVMGLRHRELAVEGVQFHPESILTEGGHRLLANWLAVCGQPEALVAVPAGPV
jgi:anthranilate synthase/aminodeoxychorismate synthase-like glutamine amidotransferase